MTKLLDVSIVLGPPPSRAQPILIGQLEALKERRLDVGLRQTEAGAKARRDLVVFDPTGVVPGELFLFDGRLQIRGPEETTLRWMLVLAQELGGRVVDNELMTYRSPTERYVHPDDQEARNRLAVAIRAARKIDQQPSKQKRRWFDW